jgi:hypothetical protein
MFVFEGTVEGRIDPGTPIMVGTWGCGRVLDTVRYDGPVLMHMVN